MRFEVLSAYLLGAAIPVLETVRRGPSFENITTLAEDYLIGILLLGAAWSASTNRFYSGIALVVAWAALSGGLFGSFFGHLELLVRDNAFSGREAVIVVVKGFLYVVALVSLVRSVRAILPGEDAARQGGAEPTR